jgi:hypothetical protein
MRMLRKVAVIAAGAAPAILLPLLAWGQPASASTTPAPQSAVAASQQFGTANQTDVFTVNSSGALTVAWVVGAGQWQGPNPISPDGEFPPGAAVAVSQQFPLNQTDAFAVNDSGALTVCLCR